MKYTAHQIRQLDTIARAKCLARGSCERCGSTQDLVWAHVFSRGRKSTRWDMDNCLCLCQPLDTGGCHTLLDGSRKGLLRDFVIAKIGEDAYYALMQKSQREATMTYDQILQDRNIAKWHPADTHWSQQ